MSAFNVTDALDALAAIETDTKQRFAAKYVRSYLEQERDGLGEAPAPFATRDADKEPTFTEAQVMALVVQVRDAMLGAVPPPPPATLETRELFDWLRKHAGGNMTNAMRSQRRYRNDALSVHAGMRYRAEAFLEGMRWRYAMRLDRAAKAISAWREQHTGALKPEAPAILNPEQAILLAALLRELERPTFVEEDLDVEPEVVQEAMEGVDEEANAE